jgi:hypothetical protein
VPAHPLAVQRPQAGRDLRPAHGVGGEGDARLRARRPQLLVHAHRQLHVLTQRVPREAADRPQDVAPEDAERAGDDHQPVERGPADSGAEERADVLGHLRGGRAAERDARLDDRSVLDHGPVRDPHRAAHRDDPIRIRAEDLDDPRQCVGLEQRIDVRRRDEVVPREVDADVHRVGASAVLLVRHAQAGIRARDVDALDGLGLDLQAVADRERDEIECSDQCLGRAVGRAVVDDHHLERVVVGREQRADACDDDLELVVCRRDQGDPGPKRTGQRAEALSVFDLLLQCLVERKSGQAQRGDGVDNREREDHDRHDPDRDRHL